MKRTTKNGEATLNSTIKMTKKDYKKMNPY